MAALTTERIAPVRALLAARMDELVVPGVAVGVIHAGIEETAFAGVTSVADPLPVNADTLFQIGSTTKTMTATLAVHLAEAGIVDLDAPVRSYLPELHLADEAAAAAVTLRDLFGHRGGWLGDYFEDTGRGDDALARMVGRLEALPQLTPIGTAWHYGNSGFYVAGRVIEVVTGMTFERAMHDLLLGPLGMTRSFFFAEDCIAHRVAVGHMVRGETAEVAWRWALPRNAHAAGGIASTVQDQLRYARFHLGDERSSSGDGPAAEGVRLISRAGLEAMREPNGPGAAVGLSWWIRTVDGERVVSHGGTTAGQQSEFVLVPSRGFGITVLANSTRGHALGREIVRLALREYCGIDDRDPVARPAAPGELASFGGRYQIGRSQLELRFEPPPPAGAAGGAAETTGGAEQTTGGVAGEALVLEVGARPGVDAPPNGWPPFPPPARCAVIGTDELAVIDGPMRGSRLQVLREEDGEIEWVRFGLRLYAPEARASRYPAHGSGLVT